MLDVTNSNFDQEVLRSSGLVVVDFWAPWCGPCKIMSPIVEALAGDYNGKAKIVKLNVDENQDLASAYNILSIPTLLFFKDGKIVDQNIGSSTKEILTEKINKYL